jgi:hypothetical protein
MAQVGRIASGYVYYVSLKGVTGAGHLDTDAVGQMLPRIREHVKRAGGRGLRHPRRAHGAGGRLAPPMPSSSAPRSSSSSKASRATGWCRSSPNSWPDPPGARRLARRDRQERVWSLIRMLQNTARTQEIP